MLEGRLHVLKVPRVKVSRTGQHFVHERVHSVSERLKQRNGIGLCGHLDSHVPTYNQWVTVDNDLYLM